MQTEFKPYRSRNIRFLLLFLASMVVFGNEYAFNNPQSLEVAMQDDLDIGETQFQLLYTIFAFPNIFATFFLGFLIDIIGVRIGLVGFALGVVLFQLLIAIGGYAYSYSTILIGRLLFGLSSCTLVTAQASMITFWFKGKELAFALGIAFTFPELGNAFNSLITPLIYQNTQSLGTPLLTSVFVCVISLVCAILAAFLDKKADDVILTLLSMMQNTT